MNSNNAIETKERYREIKGFRNIAQLKISATVITTIAWLAFSLYWIAFRWGGYSFFQNIILLAVIFLIFSAINAILCVLE